MNNTTCLAEIIRAYHSNVSRKEMKVLRAKLRRAGVTCLTKAARGPYTVNPSSDVQSDVRAEAGTIVAQVASMVRAA